MADQADTSSMAYYEPVQMSVDDMKKMLAQNPTAHELLGKARAPVPEDFKGCKCATSRCRNRNCPCHRASYPCTWKCKCVECGSPSGDKASDPNPGPVMRCKCKVSGCTNMSCCCLKDSHRCSSKCECKNCRNRNGVSGSEPEQPDDTSSMAREPPQMDIRRASKRPQTEPSSGIEPEQADTSSIAYYEPVQMSVADMKKMLAQNPTAHVLLGKARRPVPENFKGCKCPTSRCRNRHCPCHRASYPCTWKCKCVDCGSPSGDKTSDPNTGPGDPKSLVVA